MSRCQEKAKHIKMLTKKYDILKEDLRPFQNKNEAPERDHIYLVKELSDKTLDEHEMDL